MPAANKSLEAYMYIDLKLSVSRKLILYTTAHYPQLFFTNKAAVLPSSWVTNQFGQLQSQPQRLLRTCTSQKSCNMSAWYWFAGLACSDVTFGDKFVQQALQERLHWHWTKVKTCFDYICIPTYRCLQ